MRRSIFVTSVCAVAVAVAGCAQVLGGLADPVDPVDASSSSDGASGADAGASSSTDGAVSGSDATVADGSNATEAGSFVRSFSVNVTVSGNKFLAADAIGVTSAPMGAGGTYSTGAIYTGALAACTRVVGGMATKAEVTVMAYVQSPNPVGPGTFPVKQGTATETFGFVQWFARDNSCAPIVAFSGTSGTLTLDVVSSTELKGSFSATLSSGDHIVGTFDIPYCSGASIAALSQWGTCQ